ncbi:hypothetical protein VNO77_35314 [Canavalia gladiata]|uniref:Uncharacterized protein n=1 Tax=Canavalia gladiata TaxID=3824 RepID=A0AAN9KH49_CANGL
MLGKMLSEVWEVLDKIKEFSKWVCNGSWVHCIEPEAIKSARASQLHFLAHVDPFDAARNITKLNLETMLVVVVSKTSITTETMLNAQTLREWISSALGPFAVAKNMVAVSTNVMLEEKIGIDPNNAFAFWDWSQAQESERWRSRKWITVNHEPPIAFLMGTVHKLCRDEGVLSLHSNYLT